MIVLAVAVLFETVRASQPMWRQSALSGLPVVLFGLGVALLFVAIYQQRAGVILVMAVSALALTIVAWIAAAYAPQPDDDALPVSGETAGDQ